MSDYLAKMEACITEVKKRHAVHSFFVDGIKNNLKGMDKQKLLSDNIVDYLFDKNFKKLVRLQDRCLPGIGESVHEFQEKLLNEGLALKRDILVHLKKKINRHDKNMSKLGTEIAAEIAAGKVNIKNGLGGVKITYGKEIIKNSISQTVDIVVPQKYKLHPMYAYVTKYVSDNFRPMRFPVRTLERLRDSLLNQVYEESPRNTYFFKRDGLCFARTIREINMSDVEKHGRSMSNALQRFNLQRQHKIILANKNNGVAVKSFDI